MTAIMEWWGYDNHRDSWIYLNREIKNNQARQKTLPLIFVDCSEPACYQVNRKEWNEPRFVFEKRIPKVIPNLDLTDLVRIKKQRNSFYKLLTDYENEFKEEEYSSVALQRSPLQDSVLLELTPEQIRHHFAPAISDEGWHEVLNYVELMRAIGTKDHGKCNEYITQSGKWELFKNIRSMNTHVGFNKPLEGITRVAYKLVCKLIRLDGSCGAPLLKSEKY